MANPQFKNGRLIEAVVNRLRLLQIQHVDADAAERQSHLQEQVETELAQVSPQERQDFLTQLKERFPVLPTSQNSAVPRQPTADQKGKPGPLELTETLVSACRSLPAEEIAQIRERLAEAGLVKLQEVPSKEIRTPKQETSNLDVTSQVAKAFRLNDATVVDLKRGLNLIPNLAVATEAIDHFWVAWKNIAGPASAACFHGCSFNRMQQYLMGMQLGMDAINDDMRQFRRLAHAFMNAFNKISAVISYKIVQKYSPAATEAAVGKVGVFSMREKICWQQYCSLWNEQSDTELRDEIQSELVRLVESVLEDIAV